MKPALALLILVTFTAAGAYAQTRAGTASTNQSAAPASFGDTDTLLKRPTPTPAPSGPVAPKDKKPVTAMLGKDNTGKENMTTFSSSDPRIYVVWKAPTGTTGEKVRVAWYSAGTKGKKLTENTQTLKANGSTSGSSYIEKPASGFPPGAYRVDVSDDGKVAQSIKFTIQK